MKRLFQKSFPKKIVFYLWPPVASCKKNPFKAPHQATPVAGQLEEAMKVPACARLRG